MDKETRSAIERATQRARRLLTEDFAEQLDATFDVRPDGRVAERGGAHLNERQYYDRAKIVAAVEHKRASGMTPKDAVQDYVRDAAFTALNRFAALKMLEARGLVQECVTRGEASSGFAEFCGLAPAVKTPDGAGYRLYIECIFDELSTEVKVLFDRRDPAAVVWPRRGTFEQLLEILNAEELKEVWGQDETIGWIYQYFNSGEERRKMREESQAPRNSRELAIRNQFFTPHYVVQFLSDNTLGRIWYEMRKGATRLGELCEYMVRQPGESFAAEGEEVAPDIIPDGMSQDELWRRPIRVPHRAKKDPRDMRTLDPACGSGHFLLYVFGLYLEMYEEAWGDEGSPASEITGRTLREDYPDLGALRRTLPSLILAHNLFGVDIDPRCAQIAQLALWMRAQRAFDGLGISRADRPAIRRSNIVIAEPMPGEKDMLAEFLAELKQDRLESLIRRALDVPPDRAVQTTEQMASALAMLVGTVWDSMQLAGEMGSLLKIEQELAGAIEKGRTEWEERQPIFRGTAFALDGAKSEALARFVHGAVDDFWSRAEKLVFFALSEYATSATNGKSARRRLFAEDAVQGFALADVLRQRFDAVLMNPPFGAGAMHAKAAFERAYPKTKNDIYAAFVERGTQLLEYRGRIGAITSRTGFFLSSFQRWREDVVLKAAPPVVIADLGLGVMDAALLEAAAYCLEAGNDLGRCRVYRTLSTRDHKQEVLFAGITGRTSTDAYYVQTAQFKRIPGAPFAYWIEPFVLRLFRENSTVGDQFEVRLGASTKNDGRYIRTAWEVACVESDKWFSLAKGGAYSPYWGDIHLVVAWRNGAHEIAAELEAKYPYLRDNIDFVLHRNDPHFSPGLTWTRRTKSPLSMRVLNAGCVFADKGPSIFPRDRHLLDATLALLAICMSKVFQHLVEVQLSAAEPTGRGGVARSYEVGIIEGTPIPPMSDALVSELAPIARRGWTLARAQASTLETTDAFVLPAALVRRALGESFADIQAATDSVVARHYGLTDEEVGALHRWSDRGASRDETDVEASDAEGAAEADDADDDGEEGEQESEASRPALFSWILGVAFGRFDIRLATGERGLPVEPSPFDPLPKRSPGMVPDGQLPFRPNGGILVDEFGHSDDIAAIGEAIFARMDLALGSERITRGLSGSTNADDYRLWLRKDAFTEHIKRYSKSRRKAPIYWRLATASGGYSVWIYIHAFTRDTLLRVQNDYVAPKLIHERRQLDILRADGGANPTAAASRAIATQQTFVEELQVLHDEVARVAPLWAPELDDGVVINAAPLWRLFSATRSWQKEVKGVWEKLVAGGYDWARLAMHLWPERVVLKCAEDRSLAIAHDLEDVFWFQDADGKWKQRPAPTQTVESLIAGRASPAVKAALKSLIEAPDVSQRRRRGQ
ncbi:BREX-1 system adenine-specific DNA-methyltransferase PglX [Candidatus Viadribacter manganicus]|uniref:site-specific DNA-methyltransferase (adenine-specific) n=1 Tax=Candidatus Viadribacter manganicus TaxID=1759059 RepID=A0A1B1AHR5_9PROT|nr:BREX-1 system adenine-specific DNA-methyltransferase PglX [Candidatus Viadribacter manganicus]ANP46081.1 hypothetical protein ATE48_09180 [Candidatus Viadribacter manganicus]